MKLKLVEERDFPLLNRKQIRFNLYYDAATPKGEDVKKAVAENLKVDSNVVVVKKINTFFGKEKADVLVYVYKSLEDFEKYGKIHKKVKKGGKKEASKEQKTE